MPERTNPYDRGYASAPFCVPHDRKIKAVIGSYLRLAQDAKEPERFEEFYGVADGLADMLIPARLGGKKVA